MHRTAHISYVGAAPATAFKCSTPALSPSVISAHLPAALPQFLREIPDESQHGPKDVERREDAPLLPLSQRVQHKQRLVRRALLAWLAGHLPRNSSSVCEIAVRIRNERH